MGYANLRDITIAIQAGSWGAELTTILLRYSFVLEICMNPISKVLGNPPSYVQYKTSGWGWGSFCNNVNTRKHVINVKLVMFDTSSL